MATAEIARLGLENPGRIGGRGTFCRRRGVHWRTGEAIVGRGPRANPKPRPRRGGWSRSRGGGWAGLSYVKRRGPVAYPCAEAIRLEDRRAPKSTEEHRRASKSTEEHRRAPKSIEEHRRAPKSTEEQWMTRVVVRPRAEMRECFTSVLLVAPNVQRNQVTRPAEQQKYSGHCAGEEGIAIGSNDDELIMLLEHWLPIGVLRGV
ncbi:hypothetical protein E4U54_008323 [Claviceps lovelessii]|nr:hypothetical protein E4U54_008323 [Claviceps lovelessii]